MQTYTSGGKLLYGINIYLEHTINAKDGLIKYNITTSWHSEWEAVQIFW